jgi:hypothetical protein
MITKAGPGSFDRTDLIDDFTRAGVRLDLECSGDILRAGLLGYGGRYQQAQRRSGL